MDANLKAKWLADLRGGKFQQANGFLHDDANDAYCCLGVLCISAGAEFRDWSDPEYFERTIEDVPVLNNENLANGDDQELSQSWMRVIGLPEEEARKLIALNDKNTPFPAIADYIEKTL